MGDGSETDTNTPAQTGTDTNWSVVSAGAWHSVALKTDGTLWTWGRNDYTQLGYDAPSDNKNNTDWGHVIVGNDFTIGIKEAGTIWSWGNNSSWGSVTGQLGDATDLQRLAPRQVTGL